MKEGFFKRLFEAIFNKKEQLPGSRKTRRLEKRMAGRKRADGKLFGGVESKNAARHANMIREVVGKRTGK